MNILGNRLEDKTSKNVNVYPIAQAHQWSLIVGLSRFVKKSSSKAMTIKTLKPHKHDAVY